MRKRYATDLSDPEWNYIEAQMPTAKEHGRPRIPQSPTQPPTLVVITSCCAHTSMTVPRTTRKGGAKQLRLLHFLPDELLMVLQSHHKCPSNQRGSLAGPFAYPPILDHLNQCSSGEVLEPFGARFSERFRPVAVHGIHADGDPTAIRWSFSGTGRARGATASPTRTKFPKLSEKGYQQRSSREFGRYTESKTGQNGPSRPPHGLPR
jgi:hypothetical protein